MDEIFEILATVPQWQPAESGPLIKNRHRQIVVTNDFPVLALIPLYIQCDEYLGCSQQYLSGVLNFGSLCRGYEEQQPIQQQPSRPRPVYPNPSPKRTIDTKRKAVSTRYILIDTI